MGQHLLCKVGDIPLGEGREFAVEGRVVALFHTEDGFYAIDGMCPHAGGPIGSGTLNNTVVTCPWHGWQFDVKTGKHCLSENITTSKYSVTVDSEGIYINVP